MHLNFGSINLDTKGLPAVSTFCVFPPFCEGDSVTVHIVLDSRKRAAVEKWAARLGAEVVEELRPLYEGDSTPLEFSTEVEADGYRIRVWTRAAAPADTNGGAPC